MGPNCFSVYLIPETLRVTILGDRKPGDAVNIEIDMQTQVRCCLVLCCRVLQCAARRSSGRSDCMSWPRLLLSENAAMALAQAIVDTVEALLPRYLTAASPSPQQQSDFAGIAVGLSDRGH